MEEEAGESLVGTAREDVEAVKREGREGEGEA